MTKKVLKIFEISHNAYNANEKQVKKALKEIVKSNPNWGWEQISLQDVYACAINRLPIRYIKKNETCNEILSNEEITKAIKYAMYKVSQNPIHLKNQS